MLNCCARRPEPLCRGAAGAGPARVSHDSGVVRLGWPHAGAPDSLRVRLIRGGAGLGPRDPLAVPATALPRAWARCRSLGLRRSEAWPRRRPGPGTPRCRRACGSQARVLLRDYWWHLAGRRPAALAMRPGPAAAAQRLRLLLRPGMISLTESF